MTLQEFYWVLDAKAPKASKGPNLSADDVSELIALHEATFSPWPKRSQK